MSRYEIIDPLAPHVDAAIETELRPWRAAVVQLMAMLEIHDLDVATFAVDSLPREAVELRRLPGIWHISRPVHVPEEAGS